MRRKQVLQDLLKQGRNVEDILYAGMPQEDREQFGKVDDWAIKDSIAHYSYWRKLRAVDIGRALQGESITWIDDFDQENARIFGELCDMSWEEVIAYAGESSAALMNQLEKMSEEELQVEWRNETPIWGAVINNGYSHPLIHISDYYQQKGDMERAAKITGMMGKPMTKLDDSPLWKGLVQYNVACGYSLQGNKHQAIEELSQALVLRPNLLEWSKQDPDLEPLRGEAAYQALYEDKE